MTAKFISSEIYRATGYGPNHPLGIQRIGTVLSLCEQLGWLEAAGPRAYVASPTATLAEILKYHDAAYVEALRTCEEKGPVPPSIRKKYGIGTMENPVFKGLFNRAATAVGGSMLAARLAAGGGVVYHPSGGTHHAMRDRASGFCYLNDPVFAVLAFLEEGFERVLYVDLDAHHGDGVESAFAGDERVFLISIHEENRWPGSGRVEDRAGGNARNLPVPARFNDSEMEWLMANAVLPLARGFEPQAMVITCGADPLSGDPLSAMSLSNGCLWDAVLALVDRCNSSVVLGGGGYNPWTVARCWTGLWGRLCGQRIPPALPPESTALLESLDCDLVDEEDRQPHWTTTLADPRNDGSIREQVRKIASKVVEKA